MSNYPNVNHSFSAVAQVAERVPNFKFSGGLRREIDLAQVFGLFDCQ